MSHLQIQIPKNMPQTLARLSSKVVFALFITLLLLQGLDMHSTLTAPSHRYETNPVIVWIASYVGLLHAMAVMKLFSILVIAALSRAWKKSDDAYNHLYLPSLAFLNIEYLLVVINNYA